MNEARVFEDNYSGVFREQEDFLGFLHRSVEKPGIRKEEEVTNHLLDLQIWSFVKAEHTLILSMR